MTQGKEMIGKETGESSNVSRLVVNKMHEPGLLLTNSVPSLYPLPSEASASLP